MFVQQINTICLAGWHKKHTHTFTFTIVVGVMRQRSYMQKTCDVAEKAVLAKKKFAEKVRKSRQNVNRDKSA